jgi:CheY-like chemotaxis protein
MDTAPSDFVHALAWSGNGRWLAIHVRETRIDLYEWVSQAEMHHALTVNEVPEPLGALALSEDGTLLAATASGQLVLWRTGGSKSGWRIGEVARGRLPSFRKGERTELAFSPGANSLAVAVGSQVTLLRLDASALQLPDETSTLSIRRISRDTLVFELVTPSGISSIQHQIGSDFDPQMASFAIRRNLAALLVNGQITLLRDRFVPAALRVSRSKADATQAVTLDVEGSLAVLPWELLLTNLDGTPLALGQGLVRHRMAATGDVARSSFSDQPTRVLVVGSSAPGTPSDLSDIRLEQAHDVVNLFHKSGLAEGEVHMLFAADAVETANVLLQQHWRVLVLLGDVDRDGRFQLGAGHYLSADSLGLMRQVPDIVLLLGDDHSALAKRLRDLGVPVIVAAGWRVDPKELAAFIGEFWQALSAGKPLVHATQIARSRAFERGAVTSWALEVRGDPQWEWKSASTSSSSGEPSDSRALAESLEDLAAASSDHSRTEPTESDEQPPKLRLLMMRRDPTLTRHLEQVWSKVGHDVHAADHEDETLWFSAGGAYDAVVLDHDPPRMNAFRVLKALRSARRRWPVLILLSSDSMNDRRAALKAGSVDYLLKPFTFSELNSRIVAIGRRKMASPNVSRLRSAASKSRVARR